MAYIERFPSLAYIMLWPLAAIAVWWILWVPDGAPAKYLTSAVTITGVTAVMCYFPVWIMRRVSPSRGFIAGAVMYFQVTGLITLGLY